MPNKNKIKAIQFEKKPTEMEKAIQELKSSMPFMIESTMVSAKVLKAKYDNLIAEGFNEQQAMDIVKARPLYE